MGKLKEEYQISESFSLKDYDAYMKRQPLEQLLMLDFLMKRYESNKKLNVIEFGAGTGRFTNLILKNLPKINLTLVEPDKNCCKKLLDIKNKYKQVKIIQSPGETFKTKSKFDLVVMATVFHHIPFEGKLSFLKLVKGLLKKDGYFLCGDNFIAEYKNMKERETVLRKSINKWINDSKKEKNTTELKMAREMKDLVFRADFGGEYFICTSLFEKYVAKARLRIKGKVNVTNTDPLDMENYFYLIMR